MTTRFTFAVILLLMAARAMGQDQSTTHTKKPSMDVATVRLTLDTPREEVLAQIQHAGYKFLELPAQGKESRVGVTLRNIDDPVQKAMVLVDNEGELFFRDGALVRIQKEVLTQRATETRTTQRRAGLKPGLYKRARYSGGCLESSMSCHYTITEPARCRRYDRRRRVALRGSSG
jgi:hypothetical protein